MTSARPLASLEPFIETLDNGLEVIVVPMPAVHRVVMDVQVRVGSRFESPEVNGVSHFLEHMLYRGTPRHPSAQAQALAFEELGGMLMAATAADHGSMATSVPPESFDKALGLFGEAFSEPIFAGIEVEKGIVREEINEDLDEDGKQVGADNLIRELAFDGHSLGFPITGTTKQLGTFDVALLERHHRAHYTAAASVLAIAGPVDVDRTLALARDVFASIPKGERVPVQPPPAQSRERFRFVKNASSQTELRLGFRAPSEHDPIEPATELLLRTIDDGMSTRLYQRICDAKGLCYEVSAGYEAYEDAGLLELAAEVAHERAGQVLAEMVAIVRELRDHGPSQAEVDKAKLRHRWQMVEILDDPGEVADFHSVSRLTRTTATPHERVEEVAAVTTDQVRDAARRIFSREGLSVVAVGLQSKRAEEALAKQVSGF